LPTIDIFLPNKTEALSITQSKDIESAARQLAGKCQLVVIKLGADGALLQAKADTIFMPSFPVNIVDTVGAGDTFDAGFLCGYLNGWGLEKSLKVAVVCSALSLQAFGGTAAQPNLEEALAFLK
ncbi:MAG TPA: carbohydrate kinase family protein, partial [Anaerolineales bacterium]|nr:carbohydrate kinase family protein [Anaerolineales bacterium]